VDPTDLNGKSWLFIFAAIPAFLAFLFVFLDDGITWPLFNHPSHNITHGEAYNNDSVILSCMIVGPRKSPN
jgi:hypothetical protein